VLPVVFVLHRITIQGLLQGVLVQKRHAHVFAPEASRDWEPTAELLNIEARTSHHTSTLGQSAIVL
jgi:hypothetical protein